MKFFFTWFHLWRSIHRPFFSRLAVFFAISLVGTRVFWTGAFPYTHDGENHLARFVNYFTALREGQFPPRFAPHLFSGYGFPVFEYNYPLANILAIPFMALKQNPEITFGILAFLSLCVTAGSWYSFLRKRFGEHSSWIGVLAIIFSSVVQSNLFYRGNIGELWAIALASLLIAVGDTKLPKQRGIRIALNAVLIAAFLLSHNVLAVFLTPFLVLWQLIHVKNIKETFNIFISWCLAGGLVLWFWLPALTELSLVVLGSDSLAAQAQDHTLSLQQIFLSPLRFGFSRVGSLDNLGWGWGVFVLIVLWLGVGQLLRADWSFWKKFHENAEKRNLVYFVTLFVLGCFLSSTFSTFVWESAPFISIMQFPWRWLSISLLGLPYIAALVHGQSGKLGRAIITMSLFIWLSMVFAMSPADRFHKDTLSYRQFPHTSLTRNENRPKTLTAETLPPWAPGPEILEGQATEINILRWTGSVHEYTIRPSEELLVREKTVFFPGWETRINGVETEHVFTDATGGLIAYSIPASEGEVQVQTSFTQRTPIRLFSEMVSLVSFATVIGLVLWVTMMRKKF